MMGPLVYSVVVPLCNEEGSLPELYRRLAAVLERLDDPYEIIFVDDGSSDRTFALLDEIVAHDKRVRAIRISRNFGHQMAITAGLESCSGQAVITMDGDLQHPPELIPQLIEQWKRGHNVVHTIRKDTERASPLKALMSRLFYWLINLASEVPIPAHAADFRLMDRTVADAFLRLREQDRFIRGLVSWIGFSQTGVEYTAGPRFAGHSKYTVRRMLRLALSAMTSFTTLPLKAAGYFGFLVAAFAFCYALYALYVRFWTGTAIPGWTSLLLAVLFLGGVQLIAIGILGAYIASIYREVKSRPLYIVQDRRGWE